tara:strand:+ start:255 stop:539 length:285 start_codon:yes stop_codon:yes gene_type:complete
MIDKVKKAWSESKLGKLGAKVQTVSKAIKKSGVVDKLQAQHERSKTPSGAFTAEDIAQDGAKQFVTFRKGIEYGELPKKGEDYDAWNKKNYGSA